jgi:integrase
MAADLKDTGALVVRDYKGCPFYEAKWRDSTRAQRKRRLGRAWLERDLKNGGWCRRRGRVRDGCLDERRAYAAMAKAIAEHEAELRRAPENRDATFDEAVDAWLEYLQHEKRIKPSTLAAYRYLLAQPRRGKKRQRGARIMREFGGCKLAGISTADVRRFLSALDREDVSARTVNIHRQVVHSIFEYAMRGDAFGLPENPAAGTTKRPEDGAGPIETFEPDEVSAIAAAARSSLHRRRPKHNYAPATDAEWQRMNDQDASLFIFAACTGLRLGELLALRWSDVDLEASVVIVSRAMSAGQEASTKSRRSRPVPLAEQAKAELRALLRRGIFTSESDHVFCRPDGGALDRSAVRSRFIRAQKEAGVRVRRFHDLRHTFGSLAIQQFDLVSVKDMMGHSKLSTTERYLHSKPRPDDAAKLTRIFQPREDDDQDGLLAA